MRIIWVHTFNPKIKNSGVFMYEFLRAFELNEDVHIKLFFLGSLSNPVQLGKNLISLVKQRHEYDVIHCQYGSFCSLMCMFLPNKKIVTLRGSDLIRLTIGTWKERLHSRIAGFFTRFSLPKYDRIIVMSNQMKNMLPPKYAMKTSVVTDPIDLTKFTQQDRSSSRKKIFPAFDDNDVLILFTSISRENPIKRFWLAESVVKKLNAINNGIKYKLVSANSFSNEDMKYVFSSADVCLLTSIYEGWPNCIKESLACNTPFVSTDVSDLKDVAIRTKNCFVCKSDVDDLAEKILCSLKMPAEDLRKRIAFLSVDNIRDKLIKEYQSV